MCILLAPLEALRVARVITGFTPLEARHTTHRWRIDEPLSAPKSYADGALGSKPAPPRTKVTRRVICYRIVGARAISVTSRDPRYHIAAYRHFSRTIHCDFIIYVLQAFNILFIYIFLHRLTVWREATPKLSPLLLDEFPNCKLLGRQLCKVPIYIYLGFIIAKTCRHIVNISMALVADKLS